jgi:hypothetical protein
VPDTLKEIFGNIPDDRPDRFAPDEINLNTSELDGTQSAPAIGSHDKDMDTLGLADHFLPGDGSGKK